MERSSTFTYDLDKVYDAQLKLMLDQRQPFNLVTNLCSLLSLVHLNKTPNTEIKFSLFDVLTKHHREELHTRLIAVLLDPEGKHLCGDLFIRSFFGMLWKKTQDDFFQVDKFDGATIEVEKYAGEFGRIDVFMQIGDFEIVIENKIWADEQENQLKRYADFCVARKNKYRILYLTPWGYQSRYHNTFNKYVILSYKNDIITWLEELLQDKNVPAVVGSIIQSYLRMLKSSIIFMDYLEDAEKIATELLKPENSLVLKNFQILFQAQVLVRNKIRNQFFDHFLLQLKTLGKFEKHDHLQIGSQEVEVWDGKYRGFILNDIYLQTVKGRLYFVIEHDWNDIYYGLILKSEEVNAGLDDSEVKKLYELMTDHLEGDKQLFLNENRWYLYKQLVRIDNKPFGDDSLNELLNSDMNNRVKRAYENIKHYVHAWKTTILKIEGLTHNI